MKQKIIASTLGFALVTSTAWMPSQIVGAVMFSPPPDSNSAPSETTGGASRGGLFTPATGEDSDSSAPSGATGGASRGLFESGLSAPERSGSGSSRGLFESGLSAPERSGSGSSRGLFESGLSAPERSGSGSSRNGASGSPRNGRRYLSYPNPT